MRPVLLAPCAPGASPTTSSRAAGSPNDGTGFPQYSWSRYARRLTLATSRQCATSRGQRVQPAISSFSVAKPDDEGAAAFVAFELLQFTR